MDLHGELFAQQRLHNNLTRLGNVNIPSLTSIGQTVAASIASSSQTQQLLASSQIYALSASQATSSYTASGITTSDFVFTAFRPFTTTSVQFPTGSGYPTQVFVTASNTVFVRWATSASFGVATTSGSAASASVTGSGILYLFAMRGL